MSKFFFLNKIFKKIGLCFSIAGNSRSGPTKRVILNPNLQKKIGRIGKISKKNIKKVDICSTPIFEFFLKNRIPPTSKAFNSHFRALTHQILIAS